MTGWQQPQRRFTAVRLGLLLWLLFAPLRILATEPIAWPPDLYDPNPQPDDVLLPLPCGGAMTFRWVQAEGTAPAGVAPGLAPLFRLVGPFAHAGRHDLLVGKYEVSRLQYETLPAATGGPCPRADEAGRLVQGGVGWYDALGYAARWSRWLAQHAGALPDCAPEAPLCVPRGAGQSPLIRLPTEAEWEYVARGGLAVTPGEFGEPLYPMADGLEHHTWYERNSDQQLKPIGQRAANPLGLHDLYGNVEELTLDLYRSPLYPGQTGAAVIRGGSVHTGRGGIDAAERNETPLYGQGGANRAPDNGLRLIVDAAAAPGAAPTRAAPLPAVAGIGGQLQVNVDTRARVSIDDSLVGRAAPGEPLELRGLPVGEHRVEVSAAGYQTLNARHAVTAGQWTQVVVLMQPSPAPGTPAVADAQPSWTSTRLGLPAILLALVLGGLGLFVIRAALARRRATPDLAPLPSLPPAMIALPGGAFRMGSRPDEPECGPDEGPRHMVHIAPFAIGKTAVTFAQYDAFCAATQRPKRPSDQGWGRRERPVIDVSWDDALAYAAWLSQETGESYRLPSEAEWEYAARAGTKTAFWTGACIDTDRANYDGNQDYHGCGAKTGLYRKQTVPAGSLPANPWGLHEVHGNVREWVQDCYHDSYVGAPTDGSAWELGGSTARVARGGSWSCQPSRVRAACRLALQPGNRGGRLGFRLAKDLPASSE